MASIRVVHLVRAKNGLPPFDRFLASFRRTRCDESFELGVIFKGFGSGDELAPYRERLAGLAFRELNTWDYGYDIRAYFRAADAFEETRLCFVNSFSEILDERWLDKLAAGLNEPGVGAAGATGVWFSFFSQWSELYRIQPPKAWSRRALKWAMIQFSRTLHAPFPNPYLRTNAFIIRRETMLRLRRPWVFTKFGAYRFEGGKHCLTRQLAAMGLRVVVVGRDGIAYRQQEWDKSNTLWQGDQGNLLVRDNQSALYDRADEGTRAYHRYIAWGGERPPLPFDRW